ncbi:MAG: hypothetical protein M1840_004630 [Geoglossum simile]|nr:MAG: hypothetical protein M1840_004630 [Geoglossum simile]
MQNDDEKSQTGMGINSPMLSVYLYDTSSVQDRLFQRSQSSSGEAKQTTDGKAEQTDKGFCGNGNTRMAGESD